LSTQWRQVVALVVILANAFLNSAMNCTVPSHQTSLTAAARLNRCPRSAGAV
jgi:hypothetical protein